MSQKGSTTGAKRNKNERRRQRRKKSKHSQIYDSIPVSETEHASSDVEKSAPPDSYVSVTTANDLKGTEYDEFAEVFSKFMTAEELTQEPDEDVGQVSNENSTSKHVHTTEQPSTEHSRHESEHEPEVPEEVQLSGRKKKQLTRLTVAELKRVVDYPHVVEVHDVTAADPLLLTHLKAYRNSVPVPRHWQYKRRYLQGKTAQEKPPYKLPHFIEATGIGKIRSAAEEQEANKSLKQKSRERIRPKMGRIEIEYELLHDAFFRHQTKPKMTKHGDLYYEGKEHEIRYDNKTPGVISDKLRAALAMPQNAPPPWLINMQRYGPPPSYPNLSIPGLNAPIPNGARYGYHPGGWGKPPVDETGQPIYGDAFGTQDPSASDQAGARHAGGEKEAELTDEPWGEVEEVSEDESESEDENEELISEEQAPAPVATDGTSSVISSVSGLSGPAGYDTPDTIELRKRSGVESPATPAQPSLYHVLEEKQTSIGSGLMGSQHIYNLPGEEDNAPAGTESADHSSLLRKKESTKSDRHTNDDDEDVIISKRRRVDRAGRSKKEKEFKF